MFLFLFAKASEWAVSGQRVEWVMDHIDVHDDPGVAASSACCLRQGGGSERGLVGGWESYVDALDHQNVMSTNHFPIHE